MENYREIPGYEGKYAVSDQGNVKSLMTNTILSTWPNKRGYVVANLYHQPGKMRQMKVHKLVAMAFLNHEPDGTQTIVVDHIDGNKLNNTLQNLQLITQQQNRVRSMPKRDLPVGVNPNGPGKWKARFKNQHLGTFDSIEAAATAYRNASSNS